MRYSTGDLAYRANPVSPDPSLGLHSSGRYGSYGPFFLPKPSPLCWALAWFGHTPEAVCGCRGHASHEVVTPLTTSPPESGILEASTPRHLPPLGFLNPSTVYSSKRLACLVSYRRHLWGSKNQDAPGNFRAPAEGPIRRPIPRLGRERRALCAAETAHLTAASVQRRVSFSAKPVVRRFCSARHSPSTSRTKHSGGGHTESDLSSGPTITRSQEPPRLPAAVNARNPAEQASPRARPHTALSCPAGMCSTEVDSDTHDNRSHRALSEPTP